MVMDSILGFHDELDFPQKQEDHDHYLHFKGLFELTPFSADHIDNSTDNIENSWTHDGRK